MRKFARVTLSLAVLVVLAVLLLPTTGCGGSSGNGTPDNWDALLWGTGNWQ